MHGIRARYNPPPGELVKLLIIDADLNFGRILTMVMEAEGNSVRLAEGGGSIGSSLVHFDPDVVLISVDANSSASVQFLEGFRSLPGAHRAATVAIASAPDDRVRRACAASNTDHMLVRPFSVLELGELVRRLNPHVSGLSLGATGAELNLENTAKLMRLWARGANGVLNCHDETGDELIILSQGGPLTAENLAVIRRMFHGGVVDFQPCDVDGDGDAARLAALIWSEASASAAPLGTRASRTTVLIPTRLSEVAPRLPLPSGLGLMLSSLQGPNGLGRLADQYGVSVETIGECLPGLVALGLVAVQEAPDMPVAVARPVQLAKPEPVHEGKRPGPLAAAPPPAMPGSAHGTLPRRGELPPSERPWADRVASTAPRSVSPGPTSAPSMAPRDRTPSVAPASPLPRPPLPPPRPPGAVAPPLPPTDPSALVRRLRREVEMLRANDAWVVLGIPHDAERAMVTRAGERMLARYEELVAKETGEARELAKTMLDGVRAAIDSLREDDAWAGGDDPGDEAFRAGLRAMSAGDWPLADRCFQAARDANLDSVRNLAHAGWARAHNPNRQLKERSSEGLELLLLAEQLDPGFAEGQYFLAVVLHRSGDDDGAFRRVRRALKADPNHLAASALGRKLRRPPS